MAASPASSHFSLSFRLAALEDRVLVEALMAGYFSELNLEADPLGLDKDLSPEAPDYRRGGFVLMSLEDEGVIGCLGVREIEPGVGEVKRMYVKPTFRGRGLGRRLLEAGLSLARGKGLRRLVLDTRLDLSAANHLYEAFGFRDIEDYNKNPRAQRFMALDL